MTTDARIAAALALLSTMGIDPQDLADAASEQASAPAATSSTMPTVADYLVTVEANTSAKGIRTYRSYWR